MVALAVTALAALLGATPSAKAPRTLPEVFSPLTWDADEASLRAWFPSGTLRAEERRERDGGRRAILVVSRIAFPLLGDARITIEQGPPGRSRMVRIETDDHRPACAVATPSEPTDGILCRWRSPEGLAPVLDRVKRRMTAQLGAPLSYEADEEGQLEWEWRFQGAKVSLLLERDEAGFWAVAVVAVR